GVQDGRFGRLDDRDDLWQLLVLLTARKAHNLAKLESRQKRGGNVQNVSALTAGDPNGGGAALAELVGREPDPRVAAEVAEECRRLLGRLEDPTLQAVAVWKMEGYTNEEIAARLGRSLATAERKLQLIRNIWEAPEG